jgi:hypothetical protein
MSDGARAFSSNCEYPSVAILTFGDPDQGRDVWEVEAGLAA